MKILLNWVINALVILLAAYILPGVHVSSFWTALVLAVVLGVLNFFVKPLLVVLTLPLTIVTFGLFLLVINAFLILIASSFVKGFSVDGFWWAFLFSVLVSVMKVFTTKMKD